MYSHFLGKKFEYNGDGPDTFDCWGLCRAVFAQNGVKLPRYVSPIQRAGIDELIKAETSTERFKAIDAPQALCIVALMIRPPYVSHVGVMLDGHRFIHIMEKSRVAIESIKDPIWSKRVRGFYIYESDSN